LVLHSDNPSTSDAFEISVVIPALNEEDSIRQLLDDVLGQTHQPAEIVITDGGSTDKTREIIEEFIAAGAPVKLVRVTKSMPGRARNLAIIESRCEWIAFTDAGITLRPEWLEALVTSASENSAEVVYGTYEPIIESFFTECAAIAYVPPPFESDGGPVRPRSIVSALMCFLIIWNVLDDSEVFTKAFVTAIILAASCSHLSLLSLAQLDKRFSWTRLAAIVCIVLLDLILLYILWFEPYGDSDVVYRMLGVLGILVASITVLTPILHKLSSVGSNLEKIDAEIAELKGKLSELETQRARLVEQKSTGIE